MAGDDWQLGREPQAITLPLNHQRKSSFTPASGLEATSAAEAATMSGGDKSRREIRDVRINKIRFNWIPCFRFMFCNLRNGGNETRSRGCE